MCCSSQAQRGSKRKKKNKGVSDTKILSDPKYIERYLPFLKILPSNALIVAIVLCHLRMMIY